MNYITHRTLITVLMVSLLALSAGTASAWLTGYDHRMAVTVNNGGGGELTYYQFNFTNDTNVLVAAGTMQASGADCRVTDASDNLIPFWNETAFNAAGTKIWANATTLAVGDNTFYMYYGNSGAASTADITEMSLTGDDFESCASGEEIYTATKSVAATDGLGLYEHNTFSSIDKAIVTYNNSQYITYIKSNGRVIVGTRTLPIGAWSLYDTGHTIEDLTDAHHTSSIGVDCDGYIHICYDEHGDVLRYRRSNDSENINGFTAYSMTGANESQVAYPRFFMSNDTLFFAYRQGDSTTGDLYLNKYNNTTQTWSKLQHEWIDGGGKSIYMDNVATAPNGDLHVSFAWRTYNVGQNIRHANYTHAYSNDSGETWRMENGTAYSMPITRAAAQCFDCAEDASLICQHHIDVDGNGNPHIAYWKNGTWQDVGGDYHLNYWHAWHNGTGWTVTQVTNYTDSPSSPVYTFCEKDFARPGILINRTTNRVYLFGRKVADGNILIITAVSPYTTWSQMSLGDDNWGWQEFGCLDYDEWHKSNVFYAMVTRNNLANPADIYVLKSNLVDTEYSSAQTLNTTKWTATQNSGSGGSWDISDSELTVTQTPHADGRYYIYSNNDLSYPAIMETRAKVTQLDSTGQTTQEVGVMPYGDWSVNAIVSSAFRNEGASQKKCTTRSSGTRTDIIYTPDPTTYHDWTIKWISGSSAKFYIDDVLIGESTSNIPTMDMPLTFFLRAYSTPDKNAELTCDWIFARKYAATEPTATIGAQETTGGGGAYNITLLSGWNIIGWTPTGSTTAHSMGGLIGGNCTYVTTRNATTGAYVNHDMAVPTVNNFTIERGWGYYTNLSAETLWECESGSGAYNITLLTGWNIIGWTNSSSTTAHSMGGLIGGNCTYVSTRNSTTGEYMGHSMTGLESEDNFAIPQGWGYYAYVTAETLWERES